MAASGESLVSHLSAPLPFLFKVLDVRDMLSIQVHPNLDQASQGFEKEEEEGVYPAHHPDRTYKDSNHKPELMVALSEFYLVQGFRSHAEIDLALRQHPEFSALQNTFHEQGLRGLVRQWMTSSQEDVNAVLRPLGKRIKPLYEAGQLDKGEIDFWAARAYFTFNRKGVCDRGILMLYLMNLVCLEPGQAVFQHPGQMHAYLEGQNVECMATSDNVVRGGLTQKKIDIEELLSITDFSATNPKIIQEMEGTKGVHRYILPEWCQDFRCYRLEGNGELPDAMEPRLVFCLEGKVTLQQAQGPALVLGAGEAALVLPGPCTFQNDGGRTFTCS
ncbi:MAG: mannose-6-phosphate isomerase, class I, partial [Saprospiraceae bacterium]|nr:mannose-6-phosphate isomerase, class I [Saprospiraceae bacterium]